jgi:hypothetical protein
MPGANPVCHIAIKAISTDRADAINRVPTKGIFDVATCLKSSGGIERFGERDVSRLNGSGRRCARLVEADAIYRVPTVYRIIFS